ncbi:MAG TPA: flagellar biosynthetic protein FliO [Chloroflexota bacterium]|nr:flagellar biosynthetic protein FliO [Chloroflexota bacterium]
MRAHRPALAVLLIGLALLGRLGLAAPVAQAMPAAAAVAARPAPAGVLAQASDDAAVTSESATDATALEDPTPAGTTGVESATAGEAAGEAAAVDESPAGEAPPGAASAATAVPAAPAPGVSEAPNAPPPAPTVPAAAPAHPAASEPLDFPGAAVDVTLKLVAVLALAYVTLWLIKRYSLGATLGKRSGSLQVIESTTLAPNRSIYLVNVEGRRLLLGVTSSQITTLAAWDGDGVPQSVPAPTPATAPAALDEPFAAK